MNRFLLALALLFTAATASAQETIVVHDPVVIDAQTQAEEMARTGALKHCRNNGGVIEGIGFSSAGPDQAVANCCFYREAQKGRYVIVERGVARGPRGWFAVLRYRATHVFNR